MKKFMALCLTIIMVISMFTVAVSAATITVPASTLVDQSFAGLSAVPSGWTISGTEGTHYTFGDDALISKKNTNPKILKTEPFNAGAQDYTVTWTFSTYSGDHYFHWATETAEDATANGVSATGYTLKADPSNYTYALYTLYKNGEKIADLVDPNNSYGNQGLRSIILKVTDTGIEVSGSAVTATTVADTNPIKAGYIGANINNENDNTLGRLSYIGLATHDFSYNVDNTQATTGGYVLNVKEGRNYINFATSTALDNAAVWTSDTVTVGEDETIDIVLNQKGMFYNNASSITFFGFTLSKSGNTTNTKLTLKQGSTQIGETVSVPTDTTTFPSANFGGYVGATVPVYITITPSTISVNVNGKKDVWTDLAYTSPRTNTSAITFSSGSTSASYRHIVSLTVDSQDQTISNSNFLLDKTFTSNDTLESLATDGFTVSGATGVSTENGIYATGTGNKPIVTFNKEFGGAYTAELMFKAEINPMELRLNMSADGKDYYKIFNDHNNGLAVKIDKYVGGSNVATLGSVTGQSSYISEKVNYAVTFEPQGNGDLKITLVATRLQNGDTKTLTVVDAMDATSEDDVDDGDPLIKGTFMARGGYLVNATNCIYAMKAYPGATAPVIAGEFLVNGTTTADKGDTVFTFPVMMLGQTADVIAALYEDGEMTDIKMVDLDELNENGYAQLFNTTASKANDVNVKVFIWDSLAGMTPVTDAFALNK